jgi:hypothetical protein
MKIGKNIEQTQEAVTELIQVMLEKSIRNTLKQP